MVILAALPNRLDPKYDLPPALIGDAQPAPGVRVMRDAERGGVVVKPWGREILLSESPDYTFKKIEIKAGFETSLQLHQKKSETIFFLTGKPRVIFEDENGRLVSQDLAPGSIFETRPPAVHRVVALTDISYVEASTPDPQGLDVIRLRDGAKRPDGRIEEEHQEREHPKRR